MDCISKRRTTF